MLILGTYISYYKSLVKVDTMRQIKDMAVCMMITFLVVGAVHISFTSLVSVFLTYKEHTPEGKSKDISYEKYPEVLISVFIEAVIFIIQYLAFFCAYRQSKKTYKKMLKFHDYLLEYRLTPRSRVFRKHMPRMTMVIEESESCTSSV